MNKLLVVFITLALFAVVPLGAEPKKDPSKMESEEFLDLSRKQLLGNCWMRMSGNINGRAKDGTRRKRLKINCAAQLVPNKITFMAAINKSQSFKVEHVFGKVHKLSVLEDKRGKNSEFEKIGINPEDLSLAFMYWDYIKELDREVIGLSRIECRRFLLADPDSGTFVKVSISVKYLGPLKVEWYKKGALKKKPHQVLTFEDFAETNKVWHPVEVKIINDKGELQVRFEKVEAAFSEAIPKNLYTIGD